MDNKTMQELIQQRIENPAPESEQCQQFLNQWKTMQRKINKRTSVGKIYEHRKNSCVCNDPQWFDFKKE